MSRARLPVLRRLRAPLLVFVAAGVVAVAVVVALRVVAPAPTVRLATIWGESAPKGAVLSTDRRTVELGTLFRPSVDGDVRAIRFFKLPGMSGHHTGTLWTADGRRLASVDFTKESADGWQQANLPKPIALDATVDYVVSYRVPEGGGYAATPSYDGSSVSSSLKVPSQNAGRYAYGIPGVFPDESWESTQYWVDVIFSSSSTPLTAVGSPSPSPEAVRTNFPTKDSAGLPVGWREKKSVTGEYVVRNAGTIVEDLRITNGTIVVEAPNVTLRRIDAVGSTIVNGMGSTCHENLVVEDSDFSPGVQTTDRDEPVIGPGGYTVRNVRVDGVPEGLRVGGKSGGCGPVSVVDSFIRVRSPDVCTDWHGDAIQGYDGAKLTVRNSSLFMQVVDGCSGTAPFFYPQGQGNTSVDVDGLLVGGGGYPFRNGMPGKVQDLYILDGTWAFAPVDVNCSVLTAWRARVVKLDSTGERVEVVRSVPCAGDGH